MPFLDPGPAVAAGGDQVSDSTDGAPAKELVEKPRQASMLACTTSGEARAPAKAGVDARARHVRRAGGEGGESTRVPHVRLGRKTTLHVSKIDLDARDASRRTSQCAIYARLAIQSDPNP